MFDEILADSIALERLSGVSLDVALNKLTKLILQFEVSPFLRYYIG